MLLVLKPSSTFHVELNVGSGEKLSRLLVQCTASESKSAHEKVPLTFLTNQLNGVWLDVAYWAPVWLALNEMYKLYITFWNVYVEPPSTFHYKQPCKSSVRKRLQILKK